MKRYICILSILFLYPAICYAIPPAPLGSGNVTDEVGTLTNGDLCTNDGTDVQCTVNTEAELETALDGTDVYTDGDTIISLFIEQASSLGDAGTLTPTAGYNQVFVNLTCTADPSAIVMTEGGSEVDNSEVLITNVGANTCTFAYASGVFEHNGGAGTSITLEQGQTMRLKYETDRWYYTGGQNSTLFVSSIAATVEHPIETASKSGAYTIGTDSAAECYGGMIHVTSAATMTACDALADGMNFCVTTTGAIAVSVDTQADDLMYLDGTALNDGDKATNTSTTGDMICCSYYDATGWWCVSGSPDGDKWTDGGP